VFFNIYTVLLMLSGLGLIGMGAGLRGIGMGRRVLNILIGVAFFGYGFYLQFLFPGGTYHVFIYVFVLPVILAVQAFKANKSARVARQAASQQPLAGYQPGWYPNPASPLQHTGQQPPPFPVQPPANPAQPQP
jgi:hypothetical protein